MDDGVASKGKILWCHMERRKEGEEEQEEVELGLLMAKMEKEE